MWIGIFWLNLNFVTFLSCHIIVTTIRTSAQMAALSFFRSEMMWNGMPAFCIHLSMLLLTEVNFSPSFWNLIKKRNRHQIKFIWKNLWDFVAISHAILDHFKQNIQNFVRHLKRKRDYTRNGVSIRKAMLIFFKILGNTSWMYKNRMFLQTGIFSSVLIQIRIHSKCKRVNQKKRNESNKLIG